jgi:deoxyribonuclease (pyrimidine dimer)
MTRINLVPPSELTDQHLFAEFRELKMVPKSLQRSLAAAWQREFDKNDSNAYQVRRCELAREAVLGKIPTEFCLGKGHVSFFYDKGHYLRVRYEVIRIELGRRGIKYDRNSEFDPDNIFKEQGAMFNLGYTPTDAALALIRARIADRIALKPNWYRKTPT